MQCIECYAMSRLSILVFSHLISTLYKVLSKSQCLNKYSIQCIVCFDLCINSVDKQDTIHNIQKHCYIYYICQYCQYRTRISNAFNAIYVDTVDTKHIHTFLPITFLIFNRFSICKKFWKAETYGFSTIPSNTIYVNTVDTRHKYF